MLSTMLTSTDEQKLIVSKWQALRGLTLNDIRHISLGINHLKELCPQMMYFIFINENRRMKPVEIVLRKGEGDERE
jgi:hypothetical protein